MQDWKQASSTSFYFNILLPKDNSLINTQSYLNVPFDLSRVIFVATANRAQPIPPPLLDRMEVIQLPGYTPEEKFRIAMQHLIPRVLDQHGLTAEFLQIPEVRILSSPQGSSESLVNMSIFLVFAGELSFMCCQVSYQFGALIKSAI